jgi:hypothetical protein
MYNLGYQLETGWSDIIDGERTLFEETVDYKGAAEWYKKAAHALQQIIKNERR